GARFGWFDPLPLLDGVRVCFLEKLAHSAEGFAAPVPQLGDSFRDELRCRPALAHARPFHVLILEVAWGLNAELRCVFGVQSLPAAELHYLYTGHAADGRSAEKMIQNIETDVPPCSTHCDEAAIDVGP